MAEQSSTSTDENEAPENASFRAQVDLPIEIIIYIMEFLPLADRINASQVCETWYEASRDQKLHRKEVVVLQDHLNRPLQCLLNSTGTFVNFHFKEVELNSKLEAFWERFCPQMQSLGLFRCVVTERMFVDILCRCYHLESLTVNNCRELLMSGRVLETEADVLALRKTLIKLRELNLTFNRYLSDAIFYRFVTIAPNLQELALTGCQISFHLGLYKKFYPTNLQPADFVLSESVLTFNVILSYIKEQAQKLKSLKLGRTLIDNNTLILLVKVPDLNLHTLHLQSCDQLSNTGIIELACGQKSLTHLDLSECSRLTDLSLIAICQNLIHLTVLNVRNCRGISNTGVVELVHLKQLTSLNLGQCELVTGEGVRTGVCPTINRKLETLNLCALFLDEQTICKIAENLPSLQFLDLNWCFDAVTDRSMQAICTSLVLLQGLQLASGKLSDAGITGTQYLDNETQDVRKSGEELFSSEEDWTDPLHRINLRTRAEKEIVADARRKEAVSRRCADIKQGVGMEGLCLDRITGLQYLDISGCNRITDVSLEYAFHFPGLKHLDLSRCQQITHIGLSALSMNNPSIEILFLNACFNVTDQAILSVVKHLRRLKQLSLEHCQSLTDVTLQAIENHCTNLQFLNVNHCNKMSINAVEHLEQILPTLRTVQRSGLLLDPATSPNDMTFIPPPPPSSKKGKFLCFLR